MRKRLNINRQTPAAVYLKITSYVGSATVYWAKHWQGTLTSGEDREGFPVTYTMTQDEADESNKGDGPYDFGGAMGAYSEGDESTRLPLSGSTAGCRPGLLADALPEGEGLDRG